MWPMPGMSSCPAPIARMGTVIKIFRPREFAIYQHVRRRAEQAVRIMRLVVNRQIDSPGTGTRWRRSGPRLFDLNRSALSECQ
jgi:hypothetical protein